MKETYSTIQKHKILGAELIAKIGSQINVGDNVIAEACHLYEKVYETELHYSQNDRRKAMCLACLYASARINKIPINIRALGFFLNMKDAAKKFASALNILKGKHNVHLPAFNIESETWGLLSNSGLSNEVIKTTQQLMLIMQKALITTGRTLICVAVPCSFYAYKASDIFKYKKLTFKAFCEKFGLKRNLKYSCKPEIIKTLEAMAKELPWMKGPGIDTKHIEIYIKDIIKYQSFLFNQAILTAISHIEEVNEDTGKPELDTSKEPGFVFRKFPKRDRDEADKKDDVTSSKKKAKHSVKREKVFDAAGNSSGLESFDLGSDDDTDYYIVSMKEVMLKKEVQIKCGLSVEEEGMQSDHVDNLPALKGDKEIKAEFVTDTGHDEDNTDEGDNEDDDDDGDDTNDNDETEMNMHLLKRQSDGTADVDPYSDEDEEFY